MLSELIAEDKRRVFELEQQLAEFEKGSKSIHASDISLGFDEVANLSQLKPKIYSKPVTNFHASDISVGLDEMGKRLIELEKQASNESKSRRDDMRRRVSHLRSTHTHIKQSLDVIVRRRDQQRYEQEKRDLFGNRSGDGEHDVNIDLEMAEGNSLDRSSSMVGNYIAQGQETLAELLSQKDRLKNAQRKVLDIMNYLGVSNNIIKAVERRDFTDKWIVIFGISFVSVFTFLLWWYFR